MSSSRLNPDQARRLQSLNFPAGLALALADHADLFAQRIWILDNSGSMAIGDGHRIVETSDGKMEGQLVTRWEELQQCSLFHAELAGLLGLQTHFRLLNFPKTSIGNNNGNGSYRSINNNSQEQFQQQQQQQQLQEFTVGEYHDNPVHVAQELRTARKILQRTQPAGVTPLTDHLKNIERTVRLFHDELQQADKQVAIVLATDGLPTNADGDENEQVQREFVQALKAMEDLPVWIVVRLCTNDAAVADFYNTLDEVLELSLDVLDDHTNEAKQVVKHNKWLNYGLPLHQCREVGFHHRLLDLIDERPLTAGEVSEFCAILFGSAVVAQWPDISQDCNAFCAALQLHLETRERTQHWDPTKKKLAPWINTKLLQQIYGKKKSKRFLFGFRRK